MKELVKVRNENGELFVSARELHKGLKVQQDFSHWIKNQLEGVDAIENGDFTKVVFKDELSKTGQTKTEYILKIDIAKEICMITGVAPRTNDETKKLSKQVRKYFIECEKELKKNKLPATYKEALIELVHQIEEKEKIEEEKQRLIHSLKVYTTTEIAKELGFRSAHALNKDLEYKKMQYKVNGTWVLCARFSELGYVNIKQMELDNGAITYDRKWTGKGREWLINDVYKCGNRLLDK